MARDPSPESAEQPVQTQLARIVLMVFLLTFISARILVFLIMSRRMPDFYLHLGGTHIHHLNYGIFLLSGLGAYLLFGHPEGRHLKTAAVLYGVGMALTYDEFGMWIRLGGQYWQRASVDAMGVLAALFGLIAYAPSIKKFRPRHWWSAVAVTLAVAVFFAMLMESFHYARRVMGPRLEEIESHAPR
jgi:hypothetical protein